MSIRREERGKGAGERGTLDLRQKGLQRPQAYVAIWRQAAQGEKENATDLVFLGSCFDILPSFVAKLKSTKYCITSAVLITSALQCPANHFVMQTSVYVHARKCSKSKSKSKMSKKKKCILK